MRTNVTAANTLRHETWALMRAGPPKRRAAMGERAPVMGSARQARAFRTATGASGTAGAAGSGASSESALGDRRGGGGGLWLCPTCAMSASVRRSRGCVQYDRKLAGVVRRRRCTSAGR